MNRIFPIVFVLTSAAIITAGSVRAEPAPVTCSVFLKSAEFSGLQGVRIADGTGDLPLSSLVYKRGAAPADVKSLTLHVDVDFDTEVGGEDAISLVPRLLAPDGSTLHEQQALHLWTSSAGDHVGIRSTVRYGDTDLSYVIACRRVE